MKTVDYKKLGFQNAREFAQHYFKEFDQETQKQLNILGLFEKVE